MRSNGLYRLFGTLSIPLVRGLYRLEVAGRKHVPPNGGFVVAANHTSNFDPWPLGLALFPERYLRFMAKAELYRWPLRPLIDACGAFPVNRGESDLGAIETAVTLACAGNAIAMFPEGTRRAKGFLKRRQPRPHTGAARVALAAGVPLIPAAIAGTDHLSRFERLRVRFGPAVPLPPPGTETPTSARTVTDQLMAEIERLGSGL